MSMTSGLLTPRLNRGVSPPRRCLPRVAFAVFAVLVLLNLAWFGWSSPSVRHVDGGGDGAGVDRAAPPPPPPPPPPTCVVPSVDPRVPSRFLSTLSFPACALSPVAEVVGGGAVRVLGGGCVDDASQELRVNERLVTDAAERARWTSTHGVVLQDEEIPATGLIHVQCGSRGEWVAVVPRVAVAEVQAVDDASRGLNVVVVSMDSLSRTQFLRPGKFNHTVQLLRGEEPLPDAGVESVAVEGSSGGGGLEHLEVFEMRGFNAMGDGTLTSLVPELVGWHPGNSKKLGFSGYDGTSGPKRLDGWKWLFYELRELGFVTHFQLDDCSDLWTRSMKGFNATPWDLPPDPTLTGTQYDACSGGVEQFCTPEQTVRDDRSQRVLDYTRSVLLRHDTGVEGATEGEDDREQRQRQRTPTFSFVHMMAGHEGSGAQVGRIDAPLARFLSWLDGEAPDQLARRTAVILAGDHGPRYGEYRQTLEGKLEERLPLMTLLLPRWLRDVHPRLVRNLELNADRLATPLDIHQTLRHLARIPASEEENLEPAFSEATKENGGVSLLHEIPPERTCETIGLEMHWCSCMQWRPLLLGTPEREREEGALLALEDAAQKHLNEQAALGGAAAGGAGAVARCREWNVVRGSSRGQPRPGSDNSSTSAAPQKLDLGREVRTYNILARRKTEEFALDTSLVEYQLRAQILAHPSFTPDEAERADYIPVGVFEAVAHVASDGEGDRLDVRLLQMTRQDRHAPMSAPCKDSRVLAAFCACSNWIPNKAHDDMVGDDGMGTML